MDLRTDKISTLFKKYFIPTLFGMLSMSAVTAIDGVFVGHTGARPEPGQKKMNYIAFRRKTKKRYPIEPVRTLSLPQMVDNPNVSELIREDINDMIVKRLNHNIKRFLI